MDHVISAMNNVTRWPNDCVIHLAAICRSVPHCVPFNNIHHCQREIVLTDKELKFVIEKILR